MLEVESAPFEVTFVLINQILKGCTVFDSGRNFSSCSSKKYEVELLHVLGKDPDGLWTSCN